MDSIRIAKALIRLARTLVAYRTPSIDPGELTRAYFVGGTYTNVTGEFKHPTVHGYWANIENATFTITSTGLDWKSGTWVKGTWHDGIWRGGTWKSGKWLGGTWMRGEWIFGYDRNNMKHGKGDSPDLWDGEGSMSRKPAERAKEVRELKEKNEKDRRREEGRNMLKSLFGDDYELPDSKNDSDKAYERIFGRPVKKHDDDYIDLFGDGPIKPTKRRDITPDDIFGEGQPKQKAEPARKNTDAWILTRCSDGRQWDWNVPAGASESDIMKMFECAMQEYNLRMRGTWDMYRDSADKYSVRDDDDEDEKDIYTFTKSGK